MHSSSLDNVTISGVAAGNYNGIAHSAINGTYTSISNITLDSYDITTAGTATSSGDVGGSSVVATENRAFDVAQLQIGTLNLPATSLTGTLKTTTGKSVHGTETPFVLFKSITGDKLAFVEDIVKLTTNDLPVISFASFIELATNLGDVKYMLSCKTVFDAVVSKTNGVSVP